MVQEEPDCISYYVEPDIVEEQQEVNINPIFSFEVIPDQRRSSRDKKDLYE